jgi:hypothetical protein
MTFSTIANDEFGMNYNQLSSNKKKWVKMKCDVLWKLKNLTMQTNEETLDQITALLDGFINRQSMTSAKCISEITNLIEEHYINGSIDNNYK